MNRRAAVYSASRPPRKLPPAVLPVARPTAKKPAKRWFQSRRLQFGAIAALLVAAVAGLWLNRAPALTEQQVQALVHRAISEIPPVPSATEAYEKIRPSVVAVRSAPDDGEE